MTASAQQTFIQRLPFLGANTEGDVRLDSNQPTMLRARFKLAASFPAGRVGQQTVAHDTLKRLLSQGIELLIQNY